FVERRGLGVVVAGAQAVGCRARVEAGALLHAAAGLVGYGRGGVGDLVPVAVGGDAGDVAAPRDGLERVGRCGAQRGRPRGAVGLDVVDQGLDARVDELGLAACPRGDVRDRAGPGRCRRQGRDPGGQLGRARVVDARRLADAVVQDGGDGLGGAQLAIVDGAGYEVADVG